MLKLRFPTALAHLRIGTKLAITVGIGVVLVAAMIVNQQLSNTSVARQTELARDAMSASASPTAPTRSTT
jgi:hypothetical protein